MQAIGSFLELPLIDHLIISEKGYFSFNESGLLGKIVEEGNYDLTFAKKDKLMDKVKAQGNVIKRLEKELSSLKRK
jgi:DNA repair protein RadC